MPAYVTFLVHVTDESRHDDYASQAIATLDAHGGTIIARYPAATLFGKGGFEKGMIVKFDDRAAAVAWYESDAYQALIPLRSTVMDCQVTLLG